MTPAEHLASVGGHGAMFRAMGAEPSLMLWDRARLAERDAGTPQADRWVALYWRAWERGAGF